MLLVQKSKRMAPENDFSMLGSFVKTIFNKQNLQKTKMKEGI